MATEGAATELTVYSRNYCHLCDDMIAGLQSMQARFRFTLKVVDVDRNPALEALYGDDVPVLAHGAHELCRHRLDSPRVTEYLMKIG